MSLSSVPVFSGALHLLRRGLRSTFHEQNEEGRERLLVEDGFDEAELAILFDPQTAGGLLFGVDEGRAEEAVERLRTAGDATASVIGVVLEGGREGPRLAVRS
jgi:selenide,water dikinase